MNEANRIEKAEKVVKSFSAMAAVTGAVPVPASSAGVIAENGVMISLIADAMGENISLTDVAVSIGLVGGVNMIGRQIFIEGAKLLGWGTGNWWAPFALSGLGATTAGLQTYIIGKVAIAIGKKSGEPLTASERRKIIEEAKSEYAKNSGNWKGHENS